jgi:hypothetical protein
LRERGELKERPWRTLVRAKMKLTSNLSKQMILNLKRAIFLRDRRNSRSLRRGLLSIGRSRGS